ncbi:MAG: hypothetical protein AB1512_10235 [Thermodesulfobacteriota bacterium]
MAPAGNAQSSVHGAQIFVQSGGPLFGEILLGTPGVKAVLEVWEVDRPSKRVGMNLVSQDSETPVLKGVDAGVSVCTANSKNCSILMY